MSSIEIGECDKCRKPFEYSLIHNGFNDTVYAYCDKCGCTAFLNFYSGSIPTGLNLPEAGPFDSLIALMLSPCTCGGIFTPNAAPRCPHCGEALSAEAAAQWIEGDSPGTAAGWRWQRTWRGLYCLIVEGNRIDDPWKTVPK